MSSQRSGESSVSRLVDALEVRRNAKVGLFASVCLTVFAYGFFVVLPNLDGAGASAYKPTAKPLYLVLAFVVLVSGAMLVTVGLTVRTVVRMTMSPPKWIRRGGTAAMVAGTALTTLAVLAPLTGSVGLAGTYGRLLPLAPFVLVYGVWAVHAAHRRRYGYHGTVAALAAGIGLVGLGWLGLVEPGGFRGEALRAVVRPFFLGTNAFALLATSLLGSAVLRAGAMPARSGLAMLFALPVGLAGLTVVTYAGAPAFVFLPFGGPVGLAWATVGYDLRQGRGIPPAESFDAGVDLDPSGSG